MRNYLLPPVYFFKAWWIYSLKRKANKRFYYAGKCLVTNMSYRLPAQASKDIFIALRVYKRLLTAALKNGNTPIKVLANTNTALLAGDYKKMSFVPDYINKQNIGEEVGLFIDRGKLVNMNNWRVMVVITFAFFPVFFFCFFSKHRANYALMLKEIAEHINLLRLIKNYRIQYTYDFLPFEKDSNLLTLLLWKYKVKVDKMPSPGPLKTHNEVVIANRLLINNSYQEEEVKHFSETMLIDQWQKILPEFTFSFISQYTGNFQSPDKNTIGYYSHAAWLRKEEGHAEDGLNIAAAEEVLLKELQGYLKKNPDKKLTVFPHPREKAEIERTKAYYGKFFNDFNYSVLETDSKNSLLFNQVDLAVASFSTIIYERLFAGFKTLIGAFGIPGFPLKGSSLSNITIKEQGDFELAINHALSISEEEFFATNQLTGYRYFEYDYFKAIVK